MAIAVLPACRGVEQSNTPKVAAVVILLDGNRETWRADPSVCDPILDNWELHALDGGRHFARLLTRELAALRE